MAVAAPGWCIPYWWSQQNGGCLQFVSNSYFAGAVKSSGSDFVEDNKIGWDHLAGGGKMVPSELVKSYTDDFLTKIFQHFC